MASQTIFSCFNNLSVHHANLKYNPNVNLTRCVPVLCTVFAKHYGCLLDTVSSNINWVLQGAIMENDGTISVDLRFL